MKLNLEMPRKTKSFLLLATLCATAFYTTGCKEKDGNEQKPAAKIKLVTNATLGSYLADGEGNTLYLLTRDVAGNNNCTGGCAATWPIYYEAALTQDLLPTGLLLADFANITNADGKQQTTYKGWPLYYFAPVAGGQNTRELSGETKGEGVGAVWYVAKTDYSIMLANRQLKGLNGKNYKGDYTEGDGATQYFTDGKGRTLYVFTRDTKNKNNFTKNDPATDANWPVFTETLASIPSTLDKALFGSIDVFGKKQITYKGRPLYYFGRDANRGENQGVSVPTLGVWPVAVKDLAEAPNL